MADRDDKNSNRGSASMDKETREQAARKGGEASHKSSTAKSSSSSGVHNAPESGPCRDESGRFTECADDEKGSGQGSNRSARRIQGRRALPRRHGSSSGSSSSSSRSSRD